jgi:hypothetical protein
MAKHIFISITLSFIIACAGKNSNSGTNNQAPDHLAANDVSDTSVMLQGDSNYYPGSVIAIAKMKEARAAHTSTLLNNGTVLVCGGFAGTTSIAGAEIYDPASRSFTATSNLTTTRSEHSATLLPNGKVLIAGGYNGNYLSTTELYDPVLKTFTSGPGMTTPRSGHTATMLHNGKILFAGGVGTGWTFLSSAEIYDIEKNEFIPVGTMTVTRESHTATLLKDGKVLVTGGHRDRRENIKIYAGCEIFDPGTNEFTATASMNLIRHKHDAVLLSDGKVLVYGGSDQRDSRGVYTSSEIFDPQTSLFSMHTTFNFPRYKHNGTAILMKDHNVFMGGGSNRAEVYHSSTGKFIPVGGNMGSMRLFSATTLLNNGEVLITGGYDENNRSGNGGWLYVKK